jgi:hypothetical protein
MPFCILERDRKTFEYFKKYVEFLETENQTCLILDNKIQAKEIEDHLRLNGINSAGIDEKKREEISKWIVDHAKPFRDYLNSIKLVYVVWKCMGNSWKNISWEDFITIEDNLNQLKGNCLDTIF